MDSLGDDFAADNLHRLPAFLQRQCAKYRQKSDKNACILAYLLLEKGLRERFSVVTPIEFIYNERGKPYLRDAPHVFFSLSHCKCGVACAMAEFEIGVDIQDVRPFDFDIARRVCSWNELRQLSEADDPARLLTKMWTKKESYAKARGASVADILRLDLPEDVFFVWEKSDYYLSLFAMNPSTERVVCVALCKLPI